jgi:hypothetical protein
MSYMIRSKHDQRSVLALPAQPGATVRWVDPIEQVEPWTFVTREGAQRACNMCTDCGEVVPVEDVILTCVKENSALTVVPFTEPSAELMALLDYTQGLAAEMCEISGLK